MPNNLNKIEDEKWTREFDKMVYSFRFFKKTEIGQTILHLSEIKSFIRNLLKSEKEKIRREDMRLCSADILRGQEIERDKCKKELAGKIKDLDTSYTNEKGVVIRKFDVLDLLKEK